MSQENPTLKFTKLTDMQVLETLNNLAVDSQWDVNNAKSPKGKREAQDSLNLYASAIALIRQQNQSITDTRKHTANAIIDTEEITASGRRSDND